MTGSIGSDVIQDVRAGRSAEEIIEKHGFSEHELRDTLRNLVQNQELTAAEVYGWAILYNRSTQSIGGIRLLARDYVKYNVPVHEEDNPHHQGVIFDFSDTGLGIGGINAAANEAKRLVVPAENWPQPKRFVFSAVCRWAKQRERPEDCVAGFEIQVFSEGTMQQLKAYLYSLSADEALP